MEFQWDQGNEFHILEERKERGYTKDLVQSVFFDENNVVSEEKVIRDEQRFNILGKGKDEKIHVVAFCIRNNYIRPITAYIANKKLREIYESKKESTNWI